MTTTLITGATGFIGRPLTEILSEVSDSIHAVGRRACPPSWPGVVWHPCDLLEPEQVDAVLARIRPTHLVHLAWDVEPGRFWTSPLNTRWAEASEHLCRRFIEVGGRRLVAAGTCAEYLPDSRPCDEYGTPVIPGTPYGIAKDCVRQSVEAMCAKAGVEAAWGRIFSIYGPHEDSRRFVPTLVRNLLAERVTPCSAGEQLRDYLYVRDVASAFAALLFSSVTGPVNIASGQPIRLADFARAIANRLDRLDLLDVGGRPMAPGEPPVLTARTERLNNEVGWRPSVTMDEGIERTIAWWRMQG